jgi:hypothetical protein
MNFSSNALGGRRPMPRPSIHLKAEQATGATGNEILQNCYFFRSIGIKTEGSGGILVL